MKTSGFNIPDLDEDNKKFDSILDIGENTIDMKEYKPKKKKPKINFDKLFPAPKGSEKDMGMDSIFDGEPFKDLF